MKRSSNRLVLLVGIFLAVVAFVLIAVMFQGGGPGGGSANASAPPTTANVVIASKDVPLGAKFTADMLTTKQLPIGDKPANSYGDVSLVIGQIARKPVTAQQLITSDILNGSTNGITSIQVPAGFVGISVKVDQVSGVGTLIKAGDYVDVVTGFSQFPEVSYIQATPRPTASAKPSGSPAPSSGTSSTIKSIDAQYDQNSVKTVVEGLQVLGTLLPPVAQDANAPSSQPGTTLNGQEQIVILAASAQQAEAIRFAQLSGTIGLLLRSSTDCLTADGQPSLCPIIPTTGVTLRRMVDDFGVLPPQVIEVLEPTPYPSPMPTRTYPSPYPSPSASPSGSASANP